MFREIEHVRNKKFSTSELPKSACSQFYVVHEVHTRDKCSKSLVNIPRMSDTC